MESGLQVSFVVARGVLNSAVLNFLSHPLGSQGIEWEPLETEPEHKGLSLPEGV